MRTPNFDVLYSPKIPPEWPNLLRCGDDPLAGRVFAWKTRLAKVSVWRFYRWFIGPDF